jgi:hypothetical protein
MASGRCVSCVLILAVSLASPPVASGRRASLGLTVSRDGVLIKDGRPYRGIGVNYFDVFYHLLKDPNDASFRGEFRKLAAHGIPFVRFAANGFWPADNDLYFRNKDAFFQRLDSVVSAAEENSLGLIPSLFWNWSTVPDLVHEPISAWGNPKSRTHKFMRDYTREIVRRYRHSPSIWMWEFGNEYDDQINLPKNAKYRAPVVPALGTPESRSDKDDLTLEMLLTAFKQFAKTVRKLDRERAISSGNDLPRTDAFHLQTAGRGEMDTRAEWTSMFLNENKAFPILSIHVYLNRTRPFFSDQPVDLPAVIEAVQQIGLSAKKPVFVGEFGPTANDRKAGLEQFRLLLRAIQSAAIPLAAVWNFGGRMQSEGLDWNITFENGNACLLDEIAAINAQVQPSRR